MTPVYCEHCSVREGMPESLRPDNKEAIYFYKFHGSDGVVVAYCKACNYWIIKPHAIEITEGEYRMEKALE